MDLTQEELKRIARGPKELVREYTWTRPYHRLARSKTFYARLYYIKSEDFFYLEFDIPDMTGENVFINPDEASCSFRFCVDRIKAVEVEWQKKKSGQ